MRVASGWPTRSHFLLVTLLACGGCATTPTGKGAVDGCFKSEPSMYREVVLCLQPSGRFTLGESETVPDATISTRSEGSYVISGDRVLLTVARVNDQTVNEQTGGVSKSARQLRRELYATIVRRAGIAELFLSTRPDLPLRR